MMGLQGGRGSLFLTLFILLASPRSLWDPDYPTGDQTWVSCSGSSES